MANAQWAVVSSKHAAQKPKCFDSGLSLYGCRADVTMAIYARRRLHLGLAIALGGGCSGALKNVQGHVVSRDTWCPRRAVRERRRPSQDGWPSWDSTVLGQRKCPGTKREVSWDSQHRPRSRTAIVPDTACPGTLLPPEHLLHPRTYPLIPRCEPNIFYFVPDTISFRFRQKLKIKHRSQKVVTATRTRRRPRPEPSFPAVRSRASAFGGRANVATSSRPWSDLSVRDGT